MIYRLIIMTVNTGMWTAVIALVDVALVSAKRLVYAIS